MVKLKCYRGDSEFAYYTVVSLPFEVDSTGVMMVKTKAEGVPGHFVIPLTSIVEVIQ
jgi:hypothetical protein